MPIHDAAYNGSPCALLVLASSAISPAKLAALVSMITWRRRASAARGIVRRLTITTSVHEPAASKARTSPDPTCPVPPMTKTRKPMLCLSPSNIAGGIFKRDSVAAYGSIRSFQSQGASGHHEPDLAGGRGGELRESTGEISETAGDSFGRYQAPTQFVADDDGGARSGDKRRQLPAPRGRNRIVRIAEARSGPQGQTIDDDAARARRQCREARPYIERLFERCCERAPFRPFGAMAAPAFHHFGIVAATGIGGDEYCIASPGAGQLDGASALGAACGAGDECQLTHSGPPPAETHRGNP